MHLAFIQSYLHCIQAIHLLSVHVFPGNWTHNLCAANAMLYHWATETLFRINQSVFRFSMWTYIIYFILYIYVYPDFFKYFGLHFQCGLLLILTKKRKAFKALQYRTCTHIVNVHLTMLDYNSINNIIWNCVIWDSYLIFIQRYKHQT